MARDEQRGLRDEAYVGPDPQAARELTPMRELKRFKIADGEPDIRGWRVFTSAGRELGRVEDLLVDTEAGEVVMLDVDLRRNDQHTLAPIRAAWIDREHDRVIIDSRELESDETLPSLTRRGALSDDEVRRFGERYDRAYGDRVLEGERDYTLRHDADDLRLGRRRRAADVARDEERRAEAAATPSVPAAERVPLFVERRPRPVADDAQAVAARESRQREVDAVNAERERAARDKQVRYPTLAQPRGRVIEEVVVRRREVGPDDPVPNA